MIAQLAGRSVRLAVAGCVPTATSCAGAGTATARPDAPEGEFLAVTAGNEHSCGLRADDTVVCWGDNYYGQTDVPEGEFQAVSAGRFFTCGLRPNRAIECWGRNDEGQTEAPRGRFIAVAAGWNHSCGLRVDLGVTCWGDASFKTA